ncbi:hypothetical protein D8780_09555 [Notoacmeibacter ruber]|uniref:Uncharacterized protein n=1 Tax=Notoacmeibacter ruber TaxID=2670375 RepID=A0A3L7JD76_9HYPH|nr:hypothetical protein D8780_09555 [Notoacmeibacter ruber]
MARRIKIMTNANTITIVRVPASIGEMVKDLPEKTSANIEELRRAIDLNAIVSYALDSEEITTQTVVAADVSEEDDVTVYVRDLN